jgi:transposase
MKTLQVINPNAAGIDVGSEKLHTSIAGNEPVVFGTFTNEVYQLRDYFLKEGVKTVAMEATGVYWLYVYEVLEAAGLEVVMVMAEPCAMFRGARAIWPIANGLRRCTPTVC